MTKINNFRQLCQNWLDAPDQKTANAIAGLIDDEIAGSSHVRRLELQRVLNEPPALPIKFEYEARGLVVNRKEHPLFKSRARQKQPKRKNSKKTPGNKKKEEVNACE